MAILSPLLITPSAPTSGTATVGLPISTTQSKPPVSSTRSSAASSATPAPTSKSSASPSPSPSSSSSATPSSSALPSSSPDPTSSIPSTSTPLPPSTATPEPTSLTSAPAESSSALPEPTAPSTPQFNLGRHELIGIAIGGAVFVILVGGLCWFLGRQRRQRRRNRAAALEDDLAGSAALSFRRRSRLSRAGWSRSIDETKEQSPELTPYPLPPRRHDITHGEARDSVRVEYPYGSGVASTHPHGHGHAHPSEGGLFVPPRRHPGYAYPASDRSSMWVDGSEADMYAHDGSTIARTISTVTHPNSEYNLEGDPGATMHHPVPPHAAYRDTVFSTHSTGTFGPPQTSNNNNNTNAFGTVPMGAVGPMAAMGAHYPPPPLSQPGTLHSVQSSLSGSSAFALPPPAASHGSSAVYLTSATNSPISPMSTLPHAPHAHAPGAQAFYDSSSGASSPIGTVASARRIPAPRLLVDTKAPLKWEENSTVTSPGTGPSGWAGSAAATPIRMTSPPPSSMSFGALPHSAPSPRTDLPYSTTEPGPAASDPAVLAAVAQSSASPTTDAGGLSRRHTIVRHADGGAFDDAVPLGDDSGALHLPPAYGDIYGPPESEPGPQPVSASAGRPLPSPSTGPPR